MNGEETVDQARGLRDVVQRRRAAAPPPRVIAVASGKGGVGKTHITVNLAILAARAGRRVLIVDADLGLANADIVLGVTPTHHIGHLLDGSAGIEDVLTHGPHGLRILGATSGVQELSRLLPEQQRLLLAALQPLEGRFDLVLIDCAAGIGENVVFFASAAQEVLLVVTPEPTSLSDAYATVKVLSQQAGVSRFLVVANQAADFQGRDVFRRLSQVSERFLEARLSYLGEIPRDENVASALRSNQALVERFPSSIGSRAFAAIDAALSAGAPPEPLLGGLGLFWQTLLARREGDA